jgi:hypothetical protein
MNGSEKQIKWATDLKAETMTKVTEMRKRFEADAAKANVSTSDLRYVDGIATFDRCVANLEAKTEATWWIENRSQVVDRQFVKRMAQ